jgi:hypothetical protein
MPRNAHATMRDALEALASKHARAFLLMRNPDHRARGAKKTPPTGAQEVDDQRFELVQPPMEEVAGTREHVQARLAGLLPGPVEHGIGRHHVVGIPLGQHPVAIR